MQSNSGKVHKFLHIDESIGGNPIRIKGQSLLVLPDTISTLAPDSRIQIYGELKHSNITNAGGEIKTTGVGLIENLNNVEEKVQNLKKKKSRINCSHCGQR